MTQSTFAPVKPSTDRSSPFLRYIHNFRGFAILMVVLSHIGDNLTWEGKTGFYSLSILLFRNGTIYFVFIAGFLFQYLSQKYEYQDYLRKKLKNVIVPYLIVSIPAILKCIADGQPNTPAIPADTFAVLPLPLQVGSLYVTGAHLYPYWFIPMITIFYLISPLLIAIDRHPKLYWFLPWLILLGLLIPRPIDNNFLFSAIHFFPIYLLGMFCSHFREQVLARMNKLWPIALIIVSLLTLIEAYQRLSPDILPAANLPVTSLNREILCFVLIYGLWKFDAKLPDLVHRSLGVLANLSFGIYFLHAYVLMVYFKVLKEITPEAFFLKQGNALVFLITAVLITLSCVVAIVVVKQIVGQKSRYLIGC